MTTHCQACTATIDSGNLCAACLRDPEATIAKLNARVVDLRPKATEQQRNAAEMIKLAADALTGQGCACWRCRQPLDLDHGTAIATESASLFVVVCPTCALDQSGTGAAIDAATPPAN